MKVVSAELSLVHHSDLILRYLCMHAFGSPVHNAASTCTAFAVALLLFAFCLCMHDFGSPVIGSVHVQVQLNAFYSALQ